MYMYIYICIYIYIYADVFIYILTYICIYGGKLDVYIYIPLSMSKKMWKTHGKTNPMAHQSGQ